MQTLQALTIQHPDEFPFDPHEEGLTEPDPTTELALVALGQSRFVWEQRIMSKGSQPDGHHIEVWTVNRGGHLWNHDLVFVLDDIKREFALDPAYQQRLNRWGGQVMISHPYTAEEVGLDHVDLCYYPLQALILWARMHHIRPYFHNSVPMMLALGIALGYRRITIHGADYTLPNGRTLEADRANVEYWVAVAESFGVEVGVPPETTLLSSHQPYYHTYGYDRVWEAKAAYDAAHESMMRLSGETSAPPPLPETPLPKSPTGGVMAYQMDRLRAAVDDGKHIYRNGTEITDLVKQGIVLQGADTCEIRDS